MTPTNAQVNCYIILVGHVVPIHLVRCWYKCCIWMNRVRVIVFFLFIHTPLYVQYLISLGHRKKVKVNYQSVRWYFRNLFNRFSFTVWKNKKLPLEIYINRRAWLLWFPQRPTLCKGIKNRVIVRNAAIYNVLDLAFILYEKKISKFGEIETH